MLCSTAITSAARADGDSGSSVLPSLDLGAPRVDDAVGDNEFEVGADLAITGLVNVHRLLNLPVGSGPQAQKQSRVDATSFAPRRLPHRLPKRTLRPR